MKKGIIRYPGVKSINAILAKDFSNKSQFNDTNRIDITLDTGLLEYIAQDSENGNAIENYTFSGRIAGISPKFCPLLDKKYVLKIDFYYSTETKYVGKKDFPAILVIESTSGQTGGNFIGSEIKFNCIFPSCRHNAM